MKLRILISVLATIGFYTTSEFIYNVIFNYFTAFPFEFNLFRFVVFGFVQLMVVAAIYSLIGDSVNANRK